ncbi:hypothetical protein C0J52_17287 [Blattella germanica]|nr:hypothetical protein C0J52_17287 [Blattella germanica]
MKYVTVTLEYSNRSDEEFVPGNRNENKYDSEYSGEVTDDQTTTTKKYIQCEYKNLEMEQFCPFGTSSIKLFFFYHNILNKITNKKNCYVDDYINSKQVQNFKTYEGNKKLFKINPIITDLNENDRTLYKMGDNISLDELLTLWKGSIKCFCIFFFPKHFI